MRYVRPREYPLTPRLPIDLLDAIVERYQHSRRTFTEEEALAEVWASGEDIRRREDRRFWGRSPAADISIWRIIDLPMGNWRINCGRGYGAAAIYEKGSWRNSTQRSSGPSMCFAMLTLRCSEKMLPYGLLGSSQDCVPSRPHSKAGTDAHRSSGDPPVTCGPTNDTGIARYGHPS